MHPHAHSSSAALRMLLCTVALATSSLAISLPSLAVPAPFPSPQVTPDSYRLGPGDRLRVDIFNVPEYSGEYPVLADGSVTLPVIGAVSVQGMTLEQAAAAIAERLTPILVRSYVSLSLVSPRPITVAIAGEINRPGSYTLSGDTHAVPSLTNALRAAGGITQAADLGHIEIRRPLPNQTVEQVIRVDLWQLVDLGRIQQDILLRDGDSVFIPTAIAIDPNAARRLANTSFTVTPTQPISVAVIGQVNRPGPYTLSPTSAPAGESAILTVTQAIQQAGGITQLADIRKIQIRRSLYSGDQQLIDVDLWSLLRDGNLEQDLPLQAGDTVIVPMATALTASDITELATASFSPDAMVVNVVGEVDSPGRVEVPPNTSLTQAILAAGGFNNRARRGQVQLIRLNPDGTISRQEIEVDFSAHLTTASNPALRPNDTIVVGRSGLAQLGDVLGTVVTPITGVFGLFRLLGL